MHFIPSFCGALRVVKMGTVERLGGDLRLTSPSTEMAPRRRYPESDRIVFTIITIGDWALLQTRKLSQTGDSNCYLYLHGPPLEVAEACAKYVSTPASQLLRIASGDYAKVAELFHPKYCGSRYSFGYPVCPNLEDQTKIFKRLEPEKSIGLRLTEGYRLEPE